jgi:hypothetical protein
VDYRALIVFAMALYAGIAHADERVAAMVNSFRLFCTLETPNFTALDAKATAMKLPVIDDQGTPRQAGSFARSKAWLMPLTSGTHAVTAAESRGPKGDVVACGIYSPDARGDEMKLELVKAMGLGPPLKENVSAEGQRVTTWRLKMGPDDLTLMLAGPASGAGFHLTLMREPQAEH